MNLWRDALLTKQAQVITIFHSLSLYLTFYLTGTVPNSCHDGSRLCFNWRNFTLFNGISGLSEVRHAEFFASIESDIPSSSTRHICVFEACNSGRLSMLCFSREYFLISCFIINSYDPSHVDGYAPLHRIIWEMDHNIKQNFQMAHTFSGMA